MDEVTIIETLVRRSNAQRQQIKAAYQQANGKVSHSLDLISTQSYCLYPPSPKSLFSSVQPLDVALKAALKGELEEVVLSLLMTPAQYDSFLLKSAMKVRLFSDC